MEVSWGPIMLRAGQIAPGSPGRGPSPAYADALLFNIRARSVSEINVMSLILIEQSLVYKLKKKEKKMSSDVII